jgi:hypothetical protein
MRLVRVMVAAVAAFSCWTTARANGGGYDFGITFSGSLAPFQPAGTEHVRIDDEVLDVALGRDAATVTVRYTMVNTRPTPVRVRLGFPVEAVDPRTDGDYEADPEAFELSDARLEAIKQLQGYTVALDGARVAAAFETEPFARGAIPPFPGSDALKGIAGWMVSEVTFPPSRPVSLEIRYVAPHLGSVTYVSDDETISPLTFVYRLSTGAVWKGPIRRGRVTLRAAGPLADEVLIEAPEGRFTRAGDRWTWEFHDLEPTLEDDIRVQVVPGFDREPVYQEDDVVRGVQVYVRRKGSWAAGHQEFRATASSTLKPNKAHGFEAKNLADTAPDAPWCEGVSGDGVGQWVELRLARAAPLLGMEITPGFAMRGVSLQDREVRGEVPAAFTENGAPARIEVVLDGKHRFEAELESVPRAQLVPVLGYSKPVSKVRLTILGVRAGSKYTDTCISRVMLFDRLPAEPEHHGAR